MLDYFVQNFLNCRVWRSSKTRILSIGIQRRVTMNMKTFDWSDDLSVGVEEIDDDHKNMIKYYNDLFAACMVSMGPAVVLETLGKLIEYTKYHFQREEGLMVKEGYPGLAEQRHEHEELIRIVEEVQKKAKSDPDHEFSNDVLGFVSSWIRNHILESDLALARYIRVKH
jgi:hemerythrin